MFLAFGVLLLASSVLGEKDNLNTIYKAIKDITGFDRNDLMKMKEVVIAKKLGKQILILDRSLRKRQRDYIKATLSLPPDARRFMYSVCFSFRVLSHFLKLFFTLVLLVLGDPHPCGWIGKRLRGEDKCTKNLFWFSCLRHYSLIHQIN
ncbi:unnamed protein product [Haemonchus placei]|uniref:Secreted RxLR effector peptide protein n=1 Tax=Haemonchus placei TaxID=6290 RepID=A0A0N4W8S0_HAEPC|nr:unnamed protein product [Haemonchus placei]